MTTLLVILLVIAVVDAGLLTLVLLGKRGRRRLWRAIAGQRPIVERFNRHADEAIQQSRERPRDPGAPVWTLGSPETNREFDEITRLSWIVDNSGGDR